MRRTTLKCMPRPLRPCFLAIRNTLSTDVCDPRTGIASTSKFLPSVAEIKDACDAKEARVIQDLERERRIKKQLAERDSDEKIKAGARLTYEQLKAKYGDNKGGWLGEGGPRYYSEQEKAEFMESAKQAGKELSGMQLSESVRSLLVEQDDKYKTESE